MSKKRDTAIYNTATTSDCPNCGTKIEIKVREWVDHQYPLLTQLGLMLVGAILGTAGCIVGFIWKAGGE